MPISLEKPVSSTSIPVQPVSAVSRLSEYTAENACTSVDFSHSRHSAAYHRSSISKIRLYPRVLYFKEHVRGHGLTIVPSLFDIVRVLRTGQEERTPGCEERLSEMLLQCQNISAETSPQLRV